MAYTIIIFGKPHENAAVSRRHGLFRGAGADQLAHQETQIVAGDVEQVALVNTEVRFPTV